MKGINLSLLLRIQKDRKEDRDNIKTLIKKHDFYTVKYNIDVLIFQNVYRRMFCQELLREYSLILKNDMITNDISNNMHISYNNVRVSCLSGDFTSNEIRLRISGNLSGEKLSYTNNELFLSNGSKERLVCKIYAQKTKSHLLYHNFDSVKHQPNRHYLDKVDALSNIIAPYTFTGYEFFYDRFIYDEVLNSLITTEEHIPITRNKTDQVYVQLPERYRNFNVRYLL